MSIYEVTNLDTGSVELVSAVDCSDLSSYFPRVKIAAIDPSDTIQVAYYQNGACHNDNGPAIVTAKGTKEWWLNGNLHNEHGPAVVYANGHKSWWIKDKLHNEHGPAIVYADGDKEWFIKGTELTEEEFNEYI